MAALFNRSFVSLLVAQACFGFAFSSFFLLPKFLKTQLGAAPSEIGFVTSTFYVAAFVLQPWMGSVVDRSGRRRYMTSGAALMLVASLGFLWVDAMGPLVFGLRLLQGVAFAMAFVAGSTLAVDEAPPDHLALALGVFGLTMLSMNAIAPTVVETLAAHVGWKPAFVLAATAAAVCCVLSRFVRERRATPAPGTPLPGVLEVARRPRSLRIGGVVALAGTAFGVVFTYYQPYALDLGIHELRSFFVAYTAAAICVRLGVAPFAERVGYARLSLVALALYAGSAAALSELGRVGLAPLGAAFGLAHGLFYPTFNALAVEGSGENERGKVMALYNACFNVGVTAGVFALGFVAEAVGFPPVFRAAGGLALLGLALLAASPEGRSAPVLRRSAAPAPAATPPPRCDGP